MKRGRWVVLVVALACGGGAWAEEPVVSGSAAEAPGGWRLGGTLSGLYVPLFDGVGGSVWGAGVELQAVYALSSRFDVRAVLNYTHSESPGGAVNTVLGAVVGTAWFGLYGLGAFAGAGWSGFIDLNGTAFRGNAFSVALLATPVRLRFGGGVQHEVFLDAGGIFFFNRLAPPRPFGRLGYGVSF